MGGIYCKECNTDVKQVAPSGQESSTLASATAFFSARHDFCRYKVSVYICRGGHVLFPQGQLDPPEGSGARYQSLHLRPFHAANRCRSVCSIVQWRTLWQAVRRGRTRVLRYSPWNEHGSGVHHLFVVDFMVFLTGPFSTVTIVSSGGCI